MINHPSQLSNIRWNKVVSLAYMSIFRSLLFIQRVRRFLRAHSVMDRSGTLSPIASAVEHLIQAFHRIHFMATNNEAQHQQDPINSEYTCTRTERSTLDGSLVHVQISSNSNPSRPSILRIAGQNTQNPHYMSTLFKISNMMS